MKVGGQIPWNVSLVCETSQIYYLMVRRPMKDVLGNRLKDLLFHLVHWLSITLLLRRTSQESINLERKFYLDCSSDTLYTPGEFGRVTYWSQTLRSWKRWTHRKSTKNDSMRKRWYFPKKENLFFQSQMDESKPLEEIRNWGHPPWYGIDQFEEKVTLIFLENQKGLFHNLTTHFRMLWSDKWLLVHVRNLQKTPSRWTKSQTLLAERRIIPYSTEVHWRIQNYTYEFGCQAREAHRWLLEYWWLSKLVWSLDRFHTIHSIGRKSSRRIYVVRWEIDEKTTDIQARSSLARTLRENGKECQAEGEAKVVTWKTSTR